MPIANMMDATKGGIQCSLPDSRVMSLKYLCIKETKWRIAIGCSSNLIVSTESFSKLKRNLFLHDLQPHLGVPRSACFRGAVHKSVDRGQGTHHHEDLIGEERL